MKTIADHVQNMFTKGKQILWTIYMKLRVKCMGK